jgi:hypothetical protein
MSMSRIETSLTRLEQRLRELIEGEPGGDGISRKLHTQLMNQLIRAMKSGVERVSNDQHPDEVTLIAPDQYTLVLPAVQAQLLLTHPTELDRLTHKLENSAARSGIMFPVAPMLCVVADPLAVDIKVLIESRQAEVGDTSTAEVEGILDGTRQASAGNTPNAFLIVNGLTTYPITQPVINLGRDPSNQVHLEDTRVSRMHAQLRLIQGRFVIFDLDSLGGTFVNGVAVSSHTLNPGDVILLAGVPLVYGLEAVTQAGYTQELAVDPPAPEVL